MTVLVASTSGHGATDGIAERIGADLAGRRFVVEVERLRDVESPDRY